MAPRLNNIPGELLNWVVQELDPFSLISLSQTSKLFRTFISPTPHEFRKRLLALEILPEFSDPTSEARYDKDAWRRDLFKRDRAAIGTWNGGKFACFGCMKLLPHTRFQDYEWLYGPRAKPRPEGDQLTQTELIVTGLWRTYGLSVWPNPANDERQRMAFTDWKPFTSEAESARQPVTSEREKRRCIECKFKHRLFSEEPAFEGMRGAGYWDIDGKLPMVGVRYLFDSRTLGINFHYPGLFDGLGHWQDPWTFFHEGKLIDLNMIYQFRCSNCERWQMRRSFRNVATRRFPPHRERLCIEIDPGCTICHYCFVKENGRNKETATHLSDPILGVLDVAMEVYLNRILRWWGAARKVFSAEFKHMLDDAPEPVESNLDHDFQGKDRQVKSSHYSTKKEDMFNKNLTDRERIAEIMRILGDIPRWTLIDDMPEWKYQPRSRFFGPPGMLVPDCTTDRDSMYEHLRDSTESMMRLIYSPQVVSFGYDFLFEVRWLRADLGASWIPGIADTSDGSAVFADFFWRYDQLKAERTKLVDKIKADPNFIIDYLLELDEYERKLPSDIETIDT